MSLSKPRGSYEAAVTPATSSSTWTLLAGAGAAEATALPGADAGAALAAGAADGGGAVEDGPAGGGVGEQADWRTAHRARAAAVCWRRIVGRGLANAPVGEKAVVRPAARSGRAPRRDPEEIELRHDPLGA
ncbi:hypothetical protein [Sorangium sp. So ce394]|uniref:hypothetical protein n=1 Tax=Sorangium sp. So ce394 TaxID=3133310 RepID=UPI003F5BF2C7